jgi:tetratricopeptide (TPR) repeat protein
LSVSSRIRDPLAIVTLLSDRKFAPIVAAAPDWFNVEETMDAGIIEARLAVEANPHLLAPSIDLAEALLRAGRQPEALLVLESHMARSALKSVIGGTLEDAVAETVRALTVKALALVALQRYDDAAAQLDLAANQVLPKDRAGDFLAVAQLQVRLGLPDAALATLERLAGLAQDARADLVRFMAARSHSDTDAQNAALAALIAGAGDAPAEAQRALLLAGRIDAAADLLIRRLNDPLQRSNALLELQRMHEQVWPETAVDWRRRAAQLMSREDVRASVAASGGIVADYALYRWN